MSKPGRRAARIGALCVALLAAGACTQRDPLEHARELQAAGDFAGSLEPLRARVDQSPPSAEAQYLYGLALSRLGQPSAAVWPLRKAMDDPKWLAPAALELAVGAIRTGNAEEAIDVTGR